MEKEYFEEFIQSQFDNVHSKLDTQIGLQKIANHKIAAHEHDINKIKIELAKERGHWGAVNKLVAIGIALLGIIIGAWATYNWH